MTQPVRHPATSSPRFAAARAPLDVIQTLDALMQSRTDVPEAHLVAARHTGDIPEIPALIVVTDDSYLATTLARALRAQLPPQMRPDLLLLDPADPDLVQIRALGGELKRGPSGFQWWLLFLGF
jgi:hypothetical protein